MQKNLSQLQSSFFSIPPEIDIFAIDHGYPFAHFFLNNPESDADLWAHFHLG